MKTIKTSMEIVKIYYITGDPGEEKAKLKVNWSADEEPTAAIIDNSISNAIKLKQSTNKIEEEEDTKEIED